MAKKSQPTWLPLADIYHQVLACSPSPEAAKDVISAAIQTDTLDLRGTKRVHRAPPNIKPKVVELRPGQEPPKRPPKQPPPIEPETSYDQPLPKGGYRNWDWYRGRATQRDGKDLIEYVNIVGRRDQVLKLGPVASKAGLPGGRRGPRPKDDWPTWVAIEVISLVHAGKVPKNFEKTARDMCERFAESRSDGWAPDASAARKLIGKLLQNIR